MSQINPSEAFLGIRLEGEQPSPHEWPTGYFFVGPLELVSCWAPLTR